MIGKVFIKTGVTAGLALGLVLPMFTSSAYAAPPATPAKVSAGADTYKQLAIFAEVFDQVRGQYVDRVSDQTLVEAAINGMLSSLDPHSEFVNEKSFKEQQVEIKGEFYGLGIEVTMENGLVKVITPIDGTPAAVAGLRTGDLIVKLDSTPVLGLTLSEAVSRMRGAANTEIKIQVKREGVPNFEVTLQRKVVKIISVKSEIVENDLIYIRLATFLNENLNADMVKQFNRLRDQANGKIRGVIIDLRNNGGGQLSQAIAVSDSFLEKGEIVSTRGRNPNQIQVANATAGDITGGLPLVVLINGGSASASEIVAGALQDRHRAILVGTKTFGKGSVQSVLQVEGNAAIKFTTARYYTPSGRSIQAVGIEPDIIIPQARIEVIEEGLNFKESDMRGFLQNPNGSDEQAKAETSSAGKADGKKPATPATGSKASSNSPPSIINSADTQLKRAIEVLRGITFYAQKVK
ncbi:MAG: S41 family peptidase [Candidatus Pacebacteria bacterium]|nr:S41 family peptidase [Candidatus Paceibacterota bacterium]